MIGNGHSCGELIHVFTSESFIYRTIPGGLLSVQSMLRLEGHVGHGHGRGRGLGLGFLYPSHSLNQTERNQKSKQKSRNII